MIAIEISKDFIYMSAQVKNQAIPRVRLVAQNVLINTFT